MALAGVCLTIPRSPAGAAKKPGTTPVVVSFLDTDPWVGIQSDGNGEYVDGADQVTAIFQTGGALELNSTASPFRRLLLNFSIQNTPPPVGATSAPFDGSVIALPARLVTTGTWGVTGGVRGIAPGQTVQGTVGLQFDYDGVSWQLNFNPNDPASHGSSTVRMSRSYDGSEWTIDTGPDAAFPQVGDVAQLLSWSTAKGSPWVRVDRGQYHMPFRLTVRLK
jgi:hypothetical protein